MLNDLYKKKGCKTYMISAENPTGGKSMGAMDDINPDDPRLFYSRKSLGKGYKVCPFVRIAPKSTLLVADYKGMGVIKQIFLTSDRAKFSELVLRIFWDDERDPSVECPMGAFFCMGHDAYPHLVNSLPITVAPHRGCNCYFPMPFRKGFRIEIENEGDTYTEILAYKVMFTNEEVEENTAYFHAQYRHSETKVSDPTHVILDGVKGKGVYVGTYLAWTELHDRWWGEGEVKFYIDDDTYPSIVDNGTEDYFGGAWNFGGYGIIPGSDEVVFNSPYLGLPLVHVKDGKPKHFSMYRFHIEDAIGFEKNLKVTVDTIGWKEDFTKYEHHNEDIKSVAFFYQEEPHNTFPKLEDVSFRGDYRKE